MSVDPIPPAGYIRSLPELVNVALRLREELHDPDSQGKGNGPEGSFIKGLRSSIYGKRGRSLHLWFRGQPNARFSLAPGAFRARALGEKRGVFYEETSASFHFMLRRPEFRALFQSDFEWLTMFQHYGGLTRVLDWTENAIIAGFFAVTDKNEADKKKAGSLYILNALQLNAHTALALDAIPDRQGSSVTPAESHLGLFIDTSSDVIFRAAQAFSRDSYEWRSRIESVLASGIRAELRWLRAALDLFDNASEPESLSPSRLELFRRFSEKLSYPVAVFPYRSNARLVAQAGMFTLHGGKGPIETSRNRNDPLPGVVQIEQLVSKYSGQWLLRYEIPAKDKLRIRDQLLAIGVHRSSLFPEVQSDGEIMKDLWCR